MGQASTEDRTEEIAVKGVQRLVKMDQLLRLIVKGLP
jgi:hypothetical protein